jgi:hypothetical protein
MVYLTWHEIFMKMSYEIVGLGRWKKSSRFGLLLAAFLTRGTHCDYFLVDVKIWMNKKWPPWHPETNLHQPSRRQGGGRGGGKPPPLASEDDWSQVYKQVNERKGRKDLHARPEGRRIRLYIDKLKLKKVKNWRNEARAISPLWATNQIIIMRFEGD